MIEEENNLVFVLIGEICDDIMFFNIQYWALFILACNAMDLVMLQMKLKALLLLEKLHYLVLNLQILFEYCHFCLLPN
jgi:hypothetical protein